MDSRDLAFQLADLAQKGWACAVSCKDKSLIRDC